MKRVTLTDNEHRLLVHLLAAELHRTHDDARYRWLKCLREKFLDAAMAEETAPRDRLSDPAALSLILSVFLGLFLLLLFFTR